MARAAWRRWLTPFHLASVVVLSVGLPVLAYRFAAGLGAATHLTQQTPWGI